MKKRYLEAVMITAIYLGFFSLIGFATWFTGSAWCLWALLLTPGLKWKDDDA